MSQDELLALPTTISVETAARAIGLGRTRAYQLARRGEFPCKVIRIGASYRVVTVDLRQLLGIEPS
ncbi:helix-turn-helix domain-containing protein [Actinomadura bangladeshensis]|uniref:Helix-turn-helix domain-containing protein n=1 Tax=Actinomadura bangladeshensis TaxID=453573 RepID=A0A6L9QH48_9ACTN|nr:helix-turn-helix domain-containing protein [Actinomadura bangladeshensis]NEA23424.1 helix-turn-helix domain-containing protein [Actinomadura bangladeshensis]